VKHSTALPSCLIAAICLAGCNATPSVPTGGIAAIGLVHQEHIRAVYQIKTDQWKQDVGAGLHYVKKLLETYNSIGIPDAAADIHAVFHGDAGYWLLTDTAYSKVDGRQGPNPNKGIVAELIRRGVHIELCAQTMRSHGWRRDDVLPGVEIVVGAYPRIIDLQLHRYAYIRF
jgi:intracellular sulfur oxidation DsrE/DsrF family protein